MKKLAFLLPVLTLTACDKPTSVAELSCDMDTYWQYANVLYLDGAYPDNKHSGTEINVMVKTYDDYATVKFDTITTTFEKVSEQKFHDEFGKVLITYKGNFPGSERTALLTVDGDIANKKILQYNITFVGEKKASHGSEYSVSHVCDPIWAEYRTKNGRAAVPFNHNYKMPNRIERCITEIGNSVYCISKDDNENCDMLMIFSDKSGKTLDLTPKDALSISANWDYKNIKRYQNDGKIEEYEKDACDVLDRLNKFIHDIGLDSEKSENYIAIQREIENCDECSRIIASGDDGDFIVRVPETSMLRRITFAKKDTKFLSVSNPNQYAQTGYCLINVIPHNTMEKLDLPNKTCTYRIYCDASESMDYDQYYAVEVCEQK